jgi:hypothetical protein
MPVGLLSFAAAPSSNGGRLQVGLQGFEYYNTSIFPFANLWKCANWPIVVASAVTYNGSSGPGKSDSPWGVYLDANGDLADPMDAGITEYRRLWWENTGAGANSLIGRNMVLVFTGTATTVSFDGSPSNITRVGNRVTFTVTSDGTNRVKFSGFSDLNDPPKVTYLCFAEDEAAVLADPWALRPDALNDLREAGIIRWMDPMSINSNRATLSVNDIATPSFCKWGGIGRESGLKHGMPLEVMAHACNQVDSHLYFNMPSRIGIAKTGAITSWTRAAPSVVGSYPLPANGDEVIFYKLSGLSRTFTATADASTNIYTAGAAHNLVEDQALLQTSTTSSYPGGTNINGSRTAYYAKVLSSTTYQISATRGGAAIDLTSNGGTITFTVTPEGDKFTVANVNAGAGTFELTGPGSDTSLLSAISTSDARMNQWSTQANFTTIRNAMMDVLEALDGYLDPGLRIYLGNGNEVFNTGINFDYFYFLRAQARWSWVTIDSQSTLHGYMTGILASAADEVFADRDRWRAVIELHTAGSLSTLPFTGLAQAATDLSFAVGDLIDHGAVTSYYAESLGAGANQATLTTWISDSQAANISDPVTYPTEYTHFVERVGAACADGTGGPPTDSVYITEMPALWDARNAECVSAGITGGLIMYEGGCHIVGSSLNATTQDWLEEYFGSQPHADNISQLLALWDAETYASYPSQFLSHCIKDGATGCWGVRDQVGVDTPVSEVYAAYNSA